KGEKLMKGKFRVGLAIGGVVLLCGLGEVFGAPLLTKDKALERMLPGVEEVIKETKTLSVDQKNLIEKEVGSKTMGDSYTFYMGKSKGETTGVALILVEEGKHNKITTIVGLDPDGKVKDVAVMAHQEKRSKQALESTRWFKQFIGKTSKDPFVVGKDIDSITKATVSSVAVTTAVKKAVILYDVLYLQCETAKAADEAAPAAK
ncbi:MAG: FMN-binding protein, partial [Candidatus Latescibacterota bacterium]